MAKRTAKRRAKRHSEAYRTKQAERKIIKEYGDKVLEQIKEDMATQGGELWDYNPQVYSQVNKFKEQAERSAEYKTRADEIKKLIGDAYVDLAEAAAEGHYKKSKEDMIKNLKLLKMELEERLRALDKPETPAEAYQKEDMKKKLELVDNNIAVIDVEHVRAQSNSDNTGVTFFDKDNQGGASGSNHVSLKGARKDKKGARNKKGAKKK